MLNSIDKRKKKKTLKNVVLLFSSAAYDWKIEHHKHLVKSESRRKQYYYNYDFTGKTYEGAKKICRGQGVGWKVASFQALPSYQLDRQNKKVFAESGEVHEESVINIV